MDVGLSVSCRRTGSSRNQRLWCSSEAERIGYYPRRPLAHLAWFPVYPPEISGNPGIQSLPRPIPQLSPSCHRCLRLGVWGISACRPSCQSQCAHTRPRRLSLGVCRLGPGTYPGCRPSLPTSWMVAVRQTDLFPPKTRTQAPPRPPLLPCSWKEPCPCAQKMGRVGIWGAICGWVLRGRCGLEGWGGVCWQSLAGANT